MNNAIEITGLKKKFKDFTLDNVAFSLPKGFIMGFVGKNGAGKTTTIRLILNMLTREDGEIKLFGMDNIQDEQKIKQDIGVVFDETFFVGAWTVSDVEKAVKGFYARWSSDSFKKYLKSFGLPADKKVVDLSRGMKMKLMLAVALSHEAKLLILDEPTSGLDPVAREELLEILGSYIVDGEKTVLFSTHITSDLERIADYITLIDNGKIFYTGTKDNLIEQYLTVKGSPEDLTQELCEKIIGLTVNKTVFNGLIPAMEAKALDEKIATEAASIDDILVYISKGEMEHA